jgi:division protein 1
LTFLPDELLENIPENDNIYSLFQGFQATLPETSPEHKKHRRRISRGRRLLEDNVLDSSNAPPTLAKLKKDKDTLNHQFEMLGIRKNMCSSEIREIDNKIANLNNMRRIVLDRLADLEQEEALLEHESMMKTSPGFRRG